MLINRVLSFGSSLVIALVGAVALRDEARQAFRDRPRKGAKDQKQPPQKSPDSAVDQDTHDVTRTHERTANAS